MIRIFFGIVLTALSFSIISQRTVHASTVFRGSGSCTVSLQGEIVEGDALKLKDLVDRLDFLHDTAAGYGRVTLCLDSIGGSFPEALKIIDILQASDYGLTTVVTSGANCASACALIFLAGNYSESPGETVRVSSRVLELGFKRLGYHLPIFEVREGSYNERAIEAAQIAGITNVTNLMERNDEASFPNSLMVQFLKVRKDDLFLLDTVDKIGRWHVDLVGFFPSRMTSAMAYRGCLNLEMWRNGKSSDLNQDGPPSEESNRTITDGNISVFRFVGFGVEATEMCTVAVQAGRNPKLTITFEEAKEDENQPLLTRSEIAGIKTRLASVPGEGFWKLLPPDTKLADLPAMKASSLVVDSLESAALVNPSSSDEFTLMSNSDLDGLLLRKKSASSLGECKSMCQTQSDCASFTFNEWNSLCFLKGTSYTRYFEPSSHSGIRAGQSSVAKSSSEIIVQRYRNKIFPGDPYDTVGSRNEPACQKACNDQKPCVAYSYLKSSQSCALFNHAGEYYTDRNADSGVFRQVR